METDYDVVCAIVAVPLCLALLVLLALREAGEALKARRCSGCGRP